VTRAAALVAVTTLVIACLVSPAHAGGRGDGGLDDRPGPHLTVGLAVIAPGESGKSYDPHDDDAPRPIRYEAVPAHSPPPGLDNLCNAAQGPVAPGTVAWGWWYTVTAIDNATGQVLSRETVCVPLPDPNTPGPPPPPPVPVPPTIGEIWDAAGIPAPAVGVSPGAVGVVGLDTWLWSGGPDVVQLAVTLGGWTVTGVAHRTELRFDTGDGDTTTAPAPGSRAAPALTHVYDVKGEYALQVASVWQATVTMTGPGLAAPIPIAIGSAVVTVTQDYPVVEVRSVLLP
jgi:hypothetical protein